MDASCDCKSSERDSCQALVVGIVNIPSLFTGVLTPVYVVADIRQTALAIIRSIGYQFTGYAQMESMERR